MSKNTLINIFFDQGTQKCESKPQMASKNKINWKRQLNSKQKEAISPSGNAVKVTQFNSLIVIPNQKILRKGCQTASSSCPYKNFNIKKISEFYSKEIKNDHKNIQTQFKSNNQCPYSFLKSRNFKKRQSINKQIQKSFITTKYILKRSAPKNDLLTTSLNSSNQCMTAVDFIIDNDKINGDLEVSEQIVHDKRKQLLSQAEIKASQPKYRSNFKISIDVLSNKDSKTQIRNFSASPRKNYAIRLNQQKKYQQTLQKEKKEMLEMKKELNKNYAKPFFPPENITAFSYIIYETNQNKINKLHKNNYKKQEEITDFVEIRKMFLHSHQVIASMNSRTAVQIASLTKIMTCVVALDLGRRYYLQLHSEFTTIGLFEQNIGGTSANIKKGQIYSIQQLLYGLMLPSGNDASLAIAVWGGKLLLEEQYLKKQRQSLLKNSLSNREENQKIHFKKRESYQRFVLEMNNKASELNMQKTRYCNTHGLANPQNKSCGFDLCILCEHAMNIKQFTTIVGCKIYQSEIQIQIDENINIRRNKQYDKESTQSLRIRKQENTNRELQMEEMKDVGDIIQNFAEQEQQKSSTQEKVLLTRTIKWSNTHQLLQQKSCIYTGIKTGITNTAGPCLASCIEVKILNCKSMKHRMKDTQNLRKWLFHKQQIKQGQKIDQIINEEGCL